MKLLLIEDDVATAEYIRQGLIELGHACDHSATGLDGLTAALTSSYDAVILDRSLPQLDGLSVLQALRAEGQKVPVLILSALGQVDDRIRGLDSGADDYLPKPFSFQELISRLTAIIRRGEGVAATPTLRRVADLELNLLSRTAKRGDRTIELFAKEFQILDYLARHAGQVVTRTMMLEAVWDYGFDTGTNVIDVHISRLRSKIDHPGEPPLLHTVRGSGYRLDVR
ncbi:response regulator transcription factor [Sphingobium yanoikuyae]|jgi:two-component system OmpR family response regulator|uniref:Response regulator transcription factor n=1 Tax=Sphingobium yanoikuyae TaxID=13690 RepID=A0AA43BDK3_SPHYA|nr:response regulator transcription factor [Sphingobium yanoikuyae]MDH2134430.1 response regulator transcription factor [Sphingobium yanoikuyae]MDH2151113.1 response regulator transcription factor [Sphingobium yanoikuyae]MDH2169835.1 response regulator transcription factor [Sphingobium yanoikuyae]